VHPPIRLALGLAVRHVTNEVPNLIDLREAFRKPFCCESEEFADQETVRKTITFVNRLTD